MWPTSLFPICPSGSPTAKPLAEMDVAGYFFINSSRTGVFASLKAFPSTLSLSPKPSKIIIAFVFVILLSNKNKKLGFISDEYRQITLVTNIYKEILDERLNEKILLNKDTSVYINFITYTHYVISQENIINELLSNYTSEDAKTTYTLSNSFDLKKLTLTVTLKKDDSSDCSIYTYKLKMNKKENKIDYKLINTEFIVE